MENSTLQNWVKNGKIYYSGINFRNSLKNNFETFGYFNYSWGDINYNNSSYIFDTNYYYSKWYSNYNNEISPSFSKYTGMLKDNRHGFGTHSKSDYEVFIRTKWKVSSKLNFSLGLYYREQNLSIGGIEPVNAVYLSDITSTSGSNSHSFYQYEEEIKELKWKYEAIHWTYQITIVLDFTLNHNWNFVLMINQISSGEQKSEITDAYYLKRAIYYKDSTSIKKFYRAIFTS